MAACNDNDAEVASWFCSDEEIAFAVSMAEGMLPCPASAVAIPGTSSLSLYKAFEGNGDGLGGSGLALI